jgi:hypothetical protein
MSDGENDLALQPFALALTHRVVGCYGEESGSGASTGAGDELARSPSSGAGDELARSPSSGTGDDAALVLKTAITTHPDGVAPDRLSAAAPFEDAAVGPAYRLLGRLSRNNEREH